MLNWVLDENKYLKPDEVRKLKEYCKKEIKIRKKSKYPVRNWFLIALALNTGLRIQEIADLICGDIFIDNGQSSILVRHGKGNKKRIVRINTKFTQDCKFYLKWKEKHKEDASKKAPLFSNSKGSHYSTRTFQYLFKKTLVKAGLSTEYTLHSLRHTYGSFLLKSSGNLRIVQEQLGHSTPETTQIYTHINILSDEIDKALSKLYEDSY